MKKQYLYILTAAILLTACGKVEISPKNDIHRATDKAVTGTTAHKTLHTEPPPAAVPNAGAVTTKAKSKSAAKDQSDKKKTTAAPTDSGKSGAKTTTKVTTGTKSQIRSETQTTTATASIPLRDPAPPAVEEDNMVTETTTTTTTQAPPTNEIIAPETPDEPDAIIRNAEAPTPMPDENSDAPEPIRAKQITVDYISQYPELPTGCETTSLTMLLNYYGVYADKVDLARNFLPKQEFYWQDGVMYGADYRTRFAGDPEDENSYGCYAPCIVTAANSYLTACGSGLSAQDISGYELDTLLTDFIDNDKPVMIWITSGNLHEPSWTTVWTTPSGEQVQWYSREHCAVLTGYDYNSGIVYVSDPMVGNTSYDMETLKLRYEQFGRQCVSIS